MAQQQVVTVTAVAEHLQWWAKVMPPYTFVLIWTLAF